MRFHKFSTMFGMAVVAVMSVSPAQAVLVDYTANTAASMGAGREDLLPDTPIATNNFTTSTAFLALTAVERITAIKFGVTIPVGQQIDSATLTLHVMNFGSTASGVIGLPVYALNTDFTASEMTWNNRNASNTWALPGAQNGVSDRDASTESITTVTIPASGNTPFDWDVKDLIQSQYNSGTLSNGILVGGNTASAHGVVSFAGYGGLQGAGTQPTLSITYSAVAVPEASSFSFGLLLLGIGIVTKSRKLRR